MINLVKVLIIKVNIMNIKRFVAAFVVLFIFIFAYESFVHGILLTHIYNETPSIWRNYNQMIAYMPFNIGIMVLLAGWISFIFAHLFRDGGWRNGLRFGVYFGVLSGIQALGAYYYLPISLALAGYWFIAYLVESLIGGFLIGFIYRK